MEQLLRYEPGLVRRTKAAPRGACRSGWEMITRAGVAARRLGASAALRTVANAWRTIAGTSSGFSPFSRRLYFTAIEPSMSSTTATNASMTPWPCAATAGKEGFFQGLSALSSSAVGTRSARSCLLYCTTSGTFSGTRRFASRLTFMFSKAAWFSFMWLRRESATKTTASAPASTTRRVALYWTWPGTV